ncbi:GYDIA family GHMP kinase [Maribacter sp. PR1]|uniref:GYDIA family GHMP kinase n=1 Tax=Maribacter cobaltidurans TaxID=1178778 RepID=A0ABU7IVK8_9FLAO|nr:MULTISPECIES: GYDIA family GHMP kinase [Maribacter]MDC6389173.1 GYDIA family GHMP kinase [Maribacter sp. PR1]MEE1976561.1 GYDIA family GHMP kinase [Maribacter cobaltidurans]
MEEFYSNGKLLLTGEYAILDGAKGLAVPSRYGQFLTVKQSNTGEINWRSLGDTNTPWFTADLALPNLEILDTSDTSLANRLVQIFEAISNLNTSFINDYQGSYIDTKLTFPRHWGLGSSSTLINNMANWAQVNPYDLLSASFGGSGYDIACAQNNSPITYSNKKDSPIIEKVDFNPSFKNQIFFVHLNKKQNSRDAINSYRKLTMNKEVLIREINQLTLQMTQCHSLSEFEGIMATHENLISKTLDIPTVKQQLFNDFPGSIKSLGAWGGDFIMATGTLEEMRYFSQKGFTTILSYTQMIL